MFHNVIKLFAKQTRMRKTAQKIRRYIREYILDVRWLRSMMVPALVALIVYNFFEIKIYQTMAEITNKKGVSKAKSAALFCFYFVAGYTLKLLYEIFNAYFVSYSIRNALTNFFGEYLQINFRSFSKMGIGEAQFNINRRVYALIEFLSSFCIDFTSNVIFLLIALGGLGTEIKSVGLKLTVLLMIVLFMSFSIYAQYLRSIARTRVNIGYEISSRKMYDILYNYERIVSYDNLDYELGLYRKSMNYQVFYGTVFWVSSEVISYFNALFFVGINTYLLKAMGRSAKETMDLKSYTLVFNKVKDQVLDMIVSFDSLANNFVNMDQNILENCPLDEKPDALDIQIENPDICINNLEFAYEMRPVLKNLTLTIPYGQKLAITGINGSGKSTLIKILMGFYDYKGSVKLGGYEHSMISRKRVRDLISYIPQTTFLFDSTIIENLRCRNRMASDEKVVEYAKMYNMHENFKILGYDRAVGERGKYLSGGQRQKICFLRAVIKNSPIVILDEATSNMDEASELEIIQNIKQHMPEKTVIMIVHNLELLKHFETILFFHKNQEYECGSFDSLLENKDSEFLKFYQGISNE